MNTQYLFITVVAMGLVTFVLRALPFMAGKFLRQHVFVKKLGDNLPLTIMCLLLLDALYGQSLNNSHNIWQELLAAVVVIVFQLRTRQPLLSILAGTVLYVLLRSIP